MTSDENKNKKNKSGKERAVHREANIKVKETHSNLDGLGELGRLRRGQSELRKKLDEIDRIFEDLHIHKREIDKIEQDLHTPTGDLENDLVIQRQVGGQKKTGGDGVRIEKQWTETETWLKKRGHISGENQAGNIRHDSAPGKEMGTADRVKAAIFYLTYLVLVSAELTMLYNLELGIIILSVMLLGLVISSSVMYQLQTRSHGEIAQEYKNASDLLKALLLLPLIRILGFTLPLVFFRQIYWSLIICIPLLMAVFMLVKNLKITKKDIGLVAGKWHVQLPVALTGIGFGFIEFMIIRPKPMIDSLSPENVIIPALILMVSSGFTEEFIFRGILQTISTRLFGVVNGIMYASIMFTTMHISFNSLPHMCFVLAVAVFYGWVFQKTKTLTGVMLSHGLANIVLFLIAPFVL